MPCWRLSPNCCAKSREQQHWLSMLPLLSWYPSAPAIWQSSCSTCPWRTWVTFVADEDLARSLQSGCRPPPNFGGHVTRHVFRNRCVEIAVGRPVLRLNNLCPCANGKPSCRRCRDTVSDADCIGLRPGSWTSCVDRLGSRRARPRCVGIATRADDSLPMTIFLA